MARLVLKKYPKKPKTTASADTIKNYFAKCKEVDRDNAKRKAEHNQQKSLANKLKNFKPGRSKAPSAGKRRHKKAATKKAGRKGGSRKRR